MILCYCVRWWCLSHLSYFCCVCCSATAVSAKYNCQGWGAVKKCFSCRGGRWGLRHRHTYWCWVGGHTIRHDICWLSLVKEMGCVILWLVLFIVQHLSLLCSSDMCLRLTASNIPHRLSSDSNLSVFCMHDSPTVNRHSSTSITSVVNNVFYVLSRAFYISY